MRARTAGASLLTAVLLCSGVPVLLPAASAPAEPAELVNPFVGTQNFGNTFPGASAPFGMGKPTYNPNNEPDLHAPYMYLWAGAPAKTATVVRAAMTLFTNGPDGMTGNDDLGTMSAWYVFSSLGLYPTMSGANFLALSSPQFASATVRIGSYGKRQGGTLRITAPGAGDSRRYVRSVSLNGRDVHRTWLDWDGIAHGGTLTHELGTSPSSWGTAPGDEPPSVGGAAADGGR
ncbi:glycoside hydrolase domain-containing protein [Streptomyces sp. NPDC004647]|uniref:glycoside hydrolase domain-containing protein n=1 Tax=Streptomyces sp. NPDC004647 TaxID=3154671 RepID=UPI0033B173E7